MKRTLFILSIFTFILAACASEAAPAPAEVARSAPAIGGGMPSAAQPQLPGLAVPAAPQAQNSITDVTASGNTDQQQADARIVIKNADLTIVVKDPSSKMDEITKMAEGMGGFVVSSNLSSTYTSDGASVPTGSIVVRVPAAKMDDAVGQIKSGVIDVQSEAESGQDVTKDYVDLQSRLQNLENAQQQLTQIMQQATKTQDVLDVYQQLVSVNEQIEVLKGQIKYYDDSAAYSAINVQLLTEESIQPISVGGWKPQGVARDALQALINFFQGFGSFLIWLVIFVLPVGAVLIFLIALLWRLLRWFLRKVFPKKTPPATPAA